MLSHRETTVWDSRGQALPLRPDPERVWKQRGSFRLELRRGYRRYKKHPRVAVVVAMRELQGLDLRPDTSADWVRAWIMLAIYTLVYTALIYTIFLQGFFAAWNWAAIAITCVCLCLISIMGQWWIWRRNDAKYDELTRLLSEHPPYCASCWYPLGSKIEADGCTVCSECGAAWRCSPPIDSGKPSFT